MTAYVLKKGVSPTTYGKLLTELPVCCRGYCWCATDRLCIETAKLLSSIGLARECARCVKWPFADLIGNSYIEELEESMQSRFFFWMD